MFNDRLSRAARGPGFPEGSWVFRKDSSHLNHLQAHSLRRVCFPPTRYLEIVAESR
jgi:hypothetical protein